MSDVHATWTSARKYRFGTDGKIVLASSVLHETPGRNTGYPTLIHKLMHTAEHPKRYRLSTSLSVLPRMALPVKNADFRKQIILAAMYITWNAQNE
ncbi:uncharacterized protein LOC116432119 isoform X2 [Nomia melanderi]|nr:uncharacterized protein LOC116432119 isoform X2 [Nomia melanderi]